MAKLTTIILTKNEEKNLSRAIKSVSFSDEILIIDDNSSDNTERIAQSFKVIFIKHPLENEFAAQRNFAMQQAKHDWIFFLDADEEMSEELRKEIIILLNTADINKFYFIKRRDYFWDQEMKFGEVMEVKNNGLIRFMKKGSGIWKGRIHEKFIPHSSESAFRPLKGYIDHYPHNTISDFIKSINYYSSIRAEELFSNHKKFSIFELTIYPTAKFILNYVFYLGFLDGAAGFVYSFLMSFHSFLVRAKLFQLQNQNVKNN